MKRPPCRVPMLTETRTAFFDNPNIRRFKTSVAVDRVRIVLALPLG